MYLSKDNNKFKFYDEKRYMTGRMGKGGKEGLEGYVEVIHVARLVLRKQDLVLNTQVVFQFKAQLVQYIQRAYMKSLKS